MALIYKIEFPENIFTTARNDEPSSTITVGGQPTVITSGNRILDESLFRAYPVFRVPYVIPTEDISSQDLKVKLALEENKSKITYRVSFVGQTARDIVRYLLYIRFPGGNDDYPQPIEGIEYLFNTDKQIAIDIYDDCCPVSINGRTTNKKIIQGYIPLNTIKYCTEEGCTVDCTIFEDTKRTNAIACIESTVLGLRSNIGKLVTAEQASDKAFGTLAGGPTKFANVQAKWFDVCVPPQSSGMAFLLTSLIGLFKILIISIISPLLATVGIIVGVINLLVTAVNTLPGVNISSISFSPFDFATDLLDTIFGIDSVVEGIYGCKYIRGGYTVRSMVATACSVCGFSTDRFRDSFDFNTNNDDFTRVKIPVSENPFVFSGDASFQDTIFTHRTAYIPAETAYERRKEKKVIDDYQDASDIAAVKKLKDIAIRAASIETLDKIFGRLGSLWNTGWDVVNTPISTTTPEGIQLQLGPMEGRYSFNKENIIRLQDTTSDVFPTIQDVDICYEISDSTPIGYQTEFKSDTSDLEGNKQLKSYRGYVSYTTQGSQDRKIKNVKNFPVNFAGVNYIGSTMDETVYDDLRANRVNPVGFSDVGDFFDEGQVVMGSEISGEPKLIQFTVGDTNVIEFGKACRVTNKNASYLGATRMSDTTSTGIDSNSVNLVLTAGPFGINPSGFYIGTGVQNFIPYFAPGFDCSRNTYLNTAEATLEPIVEDLLSKFGSSEFGYSEALGIVRNRGEVIAGPFANLRDSRTAIHDSVSYNFSPLMEFTFEKENYECKDEELLLQCIVNADVLSFLGNYKLRLLKLSQGLGVVASLEIDYENRAIKAEGYVIPFFQKGIDYSRNV